LTFVGRTLATRKQDPRTTSTSFSCRYTDLFPKSLHQCIAEPKIVHRLVFFITQLPWCAALDSKDVPSGSAGHGALSGIDERLVSVHTATVTPTFRPRGFVMKVEEPIAGTQRGDDCGERDGRLFVIPMA
jgi:hypothetical protein